MAPKNCSVDILRLLSLAMALMLSSSSLVDEVDGRNSRNVAASSRVSSPLFVRSTFVGLGSATGFTGICSSRGTAVLSTLRAASDDGSMAGAAQKYLSKIPSHLQGIAIRNLDMKSRNYIKPTTVEFSADSEAARIQKELDEDDDQDEDLVLREDYDQTTGLSELEMIGADNLSKFDGDIDDAMLLRNLRSSMDPGDFARIFGPGVGELL